MSGSVCFIVALFHNKATIQVRRKILDFVIADCVHVFSI